MFGGLLMLGALSPIPAGGKGQSPVTTEPLTMAHSHSPMSRQNDERPAPPPLITKFKISAAPADDQQNTSKVPSGPRITTATNQRG